MRLTKLVVIALCALASVRGTDPTNDKDNQEIAVELGNLAEVVNVDRAIKYPSSSVAFTPEEFDEIISSLPSITSHRARHADTVRVFAVPSVARRFGTTILS